MAVLFYVSVEMFVEVRPCIQSVLRTELYRKGAMAGFTAGLCSEAGKCTGAEAGLPPFAPGAVVSGEEGKHGAGTRPQSLTSPVVMCVRELNCMSFSKAIKKVAAWNLMPVRWLTTQHEHRLRDFRHSVRNRAKQRPSPYTIPFGCSLEYSRIFGIITTYIKIFKN